MGDKHSWNSYYRHVEIMEMFIDQNVHLFNMSADDQEIPSIGKVEPNILHKYKSDQYPFDVEDIFLAVFVISTPLTQGLELKLSVKKYFELREIAGRIESRTKYYSYNISWEAFQKKALSNRIIRFDNIQGHHSFLTDHHFHCDLVYDHSTTSKQDIASSPCHVGESYPHLSEAIDFCETLLSGPYNTRQQKAAKILCDLHRAEKEDPKDWVPKIIPYLPGLEFILESADQI